MGVRARAPRARTASRGVRARTEAGRAGEDHFSAVVCLHTTAPHLALRGELQLDPHETNRRGFSRNQPAGRGRQT
jgi:hypothetical protein